MIKTSLIAISSAIVSIGALMAPTSITAQHKDAYGAPVTVLERDDYLDHTENLFAQVDMDQSGVLDVDEYAIYSLINAQMARLNGFVAVEIDGEAKRLPLEAVSAPFPGFTQAERARIDAIARNRFFGEAGADQKMSVNEFKMAADKTFAIADQNSNDCLTGKELLNFVQQQARIISTQA